MNSSSYYYFTNYTDYSLDDYYVHYYYRYVNWLAVFSAAFMNTVCAVVFAHKDLLSLGAFYQYSLVNSIGAVLGMLLLIGYTFSRCASICTEDTTAFVQLFELYGIVYICNALYFFSSLVQIAISFQLYFSVTQKFKSLSSVAPVKVIIVFLLVSFTLGISIIFSFKLVETRFVTLLSANSTPIFTYTYGIYLDQTGSNYIISFISLFFIIFSNKIFLVILIVVNILLYVELRKIMNKKIKLTKGSKIEPRSLSTKTTKTTIAEAIRPIKPNGDNENSNNEKSKQKTLIMVLWVSLVFSSSRFMFAIANLSFLLMPYTAFNWWAGAFNIFYGACVYVSYFFVYMKTNKHFNRKFYEIFFAWRKINVNVV